MYNHRLAINILIGLVWTTNILAEPLQLALMGTDIPLTVEDNLIPSTFPADLKVLDVNEHKDDIRCKDNDVCRQVNTNLPLRALPRALSSLYNAPNINAEILNSNMKAFWPVYVFQRQDLDFSEPTYPNGWYQVGLTMKKPMGWMLAKDIIEWKQALIVSYTHPGIGEERRNSVLMFDSKASLRKIVEAEDREQQVKSIYSNLESQSMIPASIISREPARFVNIDEKFYLLPVIDFEPISIFEDKANYLKIVAATPLSRANAAHPDTLDNRKFAEQASQTETIKGIKEESLGLDIKFVMDMTDSMGNYLIHTKKAIAKVTTMVANIDTKVRYGLIGYRDDITTVPELEFVTKNFTPNNLVNSEEFTNIIAKTKPAITTNDDYPEEVFAGVKEAITSTWDKNTLKLIILIGDASSHEIGHPQNTSGLEAQQLRKLANSYKVNIIAVHLKPSGFETDHILAKAQFSRLATNPGNNLPAYIPIAADNHQEFETIIEKIAETLSKAISQIRKGDIDIVNMAPITNFRDIATKVGNIAQTTVATALVDYLGNIATPPRDITAWVMDRDLLTPRIKSLQVRVLLTKRDLNDLIVTLEVILEAMRQSQLTSVQFFDALQGVITQTIKGDNTKITLVTAQKLAESGLMPSWINSLPYKSKLLEMNNELFAILSAEERTALEHDIEAKLQFYREINENSDLWTILDERNVDALDSVYPLNLDALP